MLYPIHLNIEHMKITIIGGGEVAFRKCQFFLKHEKPVTVVAEKFIPEFEEIKDKVALICDIFKEMYIEESFIVIAATDDVALNQKIGDYCHQHQKLVNIASDAKRSSFVTPAYVKRGHLLLTISTDGQSPALSAKIKRELEATYGEYYEYYVKLLGEARTHIMKTTADPIVRKEKLRRLIDFSLEELENLKQKTVSDSG